MLTKKFVFAAALALVTLVSTGAALAQSSTHGAIAGVVKDKSTSEPLAGVAIVVTSPALQGSQSAVTDGGGSYKITNLPPGTYQVNFYYLDATISRKNISVTLNTTTPVYQKFGTMAKGEVIEQEVAAPQIDTTSTKQGVTLGQDYVENIPVPGRTFESALGAAPGSSGDGLGVSFSGSSSLENQYIVDGVNTTNLTFGTVGSNLINNFIEEIEIITGGYNAEYGRATGGIVNVVTKSGSNEFKGSVWGYYTPGFLTADLQRAPRESFAMDVESQRSFDADVGFDLGGPIIKDKVWFYVGFAPRLIRNNVTTITKSRTDCRQILPDGTLSVCDPNTIANTNMPQLGGSDGNPDEDPDSGFLIFDDLCGEGQPQQKAAGVQLPGCETETDETRLFQFVSKINFAVSPEHQGQVSFNATPGSARDIGVFGEPQAVNSDYSQLTSDLAVKWTSKFNNNKTEVEAVVGYHLNHFERSSVSDAANANPGQRLLYGNLGTWARRDAEQDYTRAGCTDSTIFGGPDKYWNIENCPDVGVGYLIDGPGGLADDTDSRLSGRISGTQRVEAAGKHEVKAGLDVENNTIDFLREISGGSFYNVLIDRSQIEVFRWVRLAPPGATGGTGQDIFDDRCGADPLTGEEVNCAWLESDRVKSSTVNWAAYLRDSWQVLPNLTFNYGIRYEEQRMRYREDLQGTRDPFTGNIRDKNAMVLNNLWAPRLGFLYDWTKEGRSKIYASWGRYYDNIPLRINERSFGGEAGFTATYDATNQCGPVVDNIGAPTGPSCEEMGQPPAISEELQGGAGILVAPGIKPQFLDEVVLGVEYEVMEDLKVGLSFQNRSIGRVLEDISTDNAQTYVLANPGEWDRDEERKIENRLAQLEAAAGGADCMPEVDVASAACEADRLAADLEQYRGIRLFDKPTRDYYAVQLTASKRFSKNFFAQASYTYSILDGNYPGKFSADTGQVDPNITSQFDLIELLANRTGRLPNDSPHYFKVDGYYRFDFKEAGQVITGGRFRALSGTPIDALGRHYLYGFGESYILPRGERGRTEFNQSLDLHLSYGRQLAKGIELQVFTDLFSVFNTQETALVDEDYTFQEANPVVGGTYEDLIFLKSQTSQGAETNNPITRNRNFGNTSARYSPFAARLGVRLSF